MLVEIHSRKFHPSLEALVSHLFNPQKIATRIFERYKFDIRPTSQVNRRPAFCKRAAPARKPLRPPVVAPRRAQEYPAQGSWPMPVPVPRPLWPDLPAHHQPVLDAPGVAWVPVFIQTSPAWPSSPWPQYCECLRGPYGANRVPNQLSSHLGAG